MKNEGSSYQKLQNEDTLSTISFRPPVSPPRKSLKDRVGVKKLILILTALFIIGLILGHFVVGYHIFKCLSNTRGTAFTRWSSFLEDTYEPPKVTKGTCKDIKHSSMDVDAEYEDSVATRLHQVMTRGPLPKGYETGKLKNVVEGYKACSKGMDNLDVNEMIETVLDNILPSNSKESIAEAAALMLAHFNLDTFFKFEVAANFVEPDGFSPMLVYLSPNPDFARFPAQEDISEVKSLKLRGRRIFEPALSFAHALTQIADSSSENSTHWQILNLNSVNSENFDFESFFKKLFLDQPLIKLDGTFKFVVTNPKYVSELGKLLSKTSTETIKSLLAANLRKSFKADFDDCVKVVEKYTPLAASVLYLSTQNETDVKKARETTLTMFDSLTAKVQGIVEPYLTTEDQKEIAKERLRKVGLSTEEPEWMSLANAHHRFELEHDRFQMQKDSASIVALLRFRRFAMIKKLLKLSDKNEATRNANFEFTSQSSTKVGYSLIGNWINIPVAALMRLHYGNEASFILDISKNIVKIVDPEGFKWSAHGTQRSHTSHDRVPINLIGQQQCFSVHGIAKDSFETPAALEATYQTLLAEDKAPFAEVNLLWDLVHVIASKSTELSQTILAAGFLENHGVHACEARHVLPCFI